MEIRDIQRILELSDTVREYAGIILALNNQVRSLQNESSKVPPALQIGDRCIKAETGKTYEFDGNTWQEVTKPDAIPKPS